MSEIYFVGKTRYEDLTETGSYVVPENDLILMFCLVTSVSWPSFSLTTMLCLWSIFR